jgi:hypothetical protein
MEELNLINEPSIGRVTLPTGETAAWFYNPESTFIARFATKVVFRSSRCAQEYVYVLLLSENTVDEDSIGKAWSIADDLGSVESHVYQPYFTESIYAITDCEIKR